MAQAKTYIKCMGDSLSVENRKQPDSIPALPPGQSGLVAFSGGTSVAREIESDGTLDVTNGDGVAGNPTVKMPSVTIAATFANPRNLTVDDQGRVTACDDGNAADSTVLIAGIGTPYLSGSWANSEYIGTRTGPGSTPDHNDAGGYVEPAGPAYLDQFTCKTYATLFYSASMLLWELDPSGNIAPALDVDSGLQIEIPLAALTRTTQNTTDRYLIQSGYTVLVGADPALGWSPVSLQITARRTQLPPA